MNDYRDYLIHRNHKYKWKEMKNGKWRYYYYYPTEKHKKYADRLFDTTIRTNIGANTAKTPYANVTVTKYKGKISRAVDTVTSTTSYASASIRAKGKAVVEELLSGLTGKAKMTSFSVGVRSKK